jgi:hypothetical protein
VGRRCFTHLTVEENLLTGAFTRRDGKSAPAGSGRIEAPRDRALRHRSLFHLAALLRCRRCWTRRTAAQSEATHIPLRLLAKAPRSNSISRTGCWSAVTRCSRSLRSTAMWRCHERRYSPDADRRFDRCGRPRVATSVLIQLSTMGILSMMTLLFSARSSALEGAAARVRTTIQPVCRACDTANVARHWGGC